MSAQLAKIKASDADTLIVTTAVEELTLIFKQAAGLGLKKRIITTGGSPNPDQMIEHAGGGGTDHPPIPVFSAGDADVPGGLAHGERVFEQMKQGRELY